MRRASWLLLALGCASSVEDVAPQGAFGSFALIDVPDVERPDGVRGWIVAPQSAIRSVAYAPPRYALAYDADLDALMWRAGGFEHAPSGTSRLRRPDAIFERDGEGWRSLGAEALDWPALEAVRVDWPEDRCGAGPACFDEGGLCVPCAPLSSVASPAPPRPWPEPSCTGNSAVEDIGGDLLRYCVHTFARGCARFERTTMDGGCVRVGAECGAEWPTSIPSGEVRYVHALGDASGDGTRAAPWDLSTALSRARAGEVLVLSRGTHSATVAQLRVSALVGACVDETLVRLGGTSGSGRDLRFADLTLQAAQLGSSGHLSLDGVRVEGTVYGGEGSTLEVRRARLDGRVESYRGAVVAEDVHNDRTFGVAGGAFDARRLSSTGYVYVTGGARATVDDLQLELEGTDTTAFVANGSTVTIQRLTSHGGARALYLEGAGRYEVNGALFSNQASSITVVGAGLRAELRSVLSIDNFNTVHVEGAAAVSIDQLAATRSQRKVLHIETTTRTPGAPHVEVRDLRVAGVTKEEGLMLRSGELTLSRARIEGTFGAALHVQVDDDGDDDREGNIRAYDVTTRDTRGAAIELRGAERSLARGSFERVSIEGGTGVGFGVREGRVDLVVRDLRVRDLEQEFVAEHMRNCPVRDRWTFCAGTGVIGVGPRREVAIDLARFEITTDVVGLMFGENVRAIARDGWVRAPHGVVTSPSLEWRRVIPDVRLDAINIGAQDGR